MRNLMVVFMVFGMVACNDLFVEDLEDDVVNPLSPVMGDTIPEGLVAFWWEETEGAQSYRIHISQGDSVTPGMLVVDTSSTSTYFEYQLMDGKYTWSIKAENGASETPFTRTTFFVDSTISLEHKRIYIQWPKPDACLNDSILYCAWTPISAIDVRYQVELREAVDGNSLMTFETENNEIWLTIGSLVEGKYNLGIRGLNDVEATAFSWTLFNIDTTGPPIPLLGFPDDSALLTSGPIDFSWSINQESSACTTVDSIWIYSDSLLSFLAFSSEAEGANKTVSLAAGDYWWYVSRSDAAGNHVFSNSIHFLSLE